MATTRSAAQRRDEIRTEIATPTGSGEAMVERLAKTDPDVRAPCAAARSGEDRRPIADSLDLAIAGQHRVLAAQGEEFRSHRRSRRRDHNQGELP